MQTKKYENIGETLITERLDNGLTINIIPKPEYSKAFAMFTTNYGGADRRFKLGGEWLQTPAGVAHYLEHKMFDMPDGNALNVLSANGASPNAFTSSGQTSYYFESTTGFEDNFKTLLTFVSTPYFTVESVQKEQGIIGQEIRMVEDNPAFVVYNNLLRLLYANNPVRDSVAGTVESIAEITDKTLYHCHEVFYNPSNMTLVVVGNVDPKFVISAAKEILPKEPGEVPERDYGEAEAEFPTETFKSIQMEVSAPLFIIGSKFKPAPKGIERLRQVTIGKIALQMLLGRSSDFYTRLYAEGLLNSNFEYELDYTAGTAMILASGESRDVSSVKNELEKELENVSKNGMNTELFENAKKAFYGSELRILGSFSSLAQVVTEGALADYTPLDVYTEIEKITSDDVLNFIKENLTPKKLALSVVEPISKQA